MDYEYLWSRVWGNRNSKSLKVECKKKKTSSKQARFTGSVYRELDTVDLSALLSPDHMCGFCEITCLLMCVKSNVRYGKAHRIPPIAGGSRTPA